MLVYGVAHHKNSALTASKKLLIFFFLSERHLIFAKFERLSNCLMDSIVIFLLYLQVCLEGQISRKSAMKSLSDGYQPSGDQIPWKFCEQFQDTVFPGLSGARIVRIATHPSVMRVSLFLKHGKLSWFYHILVTLYF